MEPKISVVVPVYNPGEFIDPLIDSLLAQTMPADEFEVVFVDDGSTDDTPEKLDRLAAEHPHIQVVHIPNSGWPGRPRNVGVEHARGEYVQFVDNDDRLTPEALERLWRYAVENDSDIVIGKEVRGPRNWMLVSMFSRNIPDAQLGRDPILGLLTPHKMFRRSMLVEHGVRFAEEKRRLEDHFFVLKAYAAARRISVLGEHPIYHWYQRPDRSNAGARPRVWDEWYRFMEDAVGVLKETVPPGPVRNQLLMSWYRPKVLGKGVNAMNNPDVAEEYYAAARGVMERSFPVELDELLHAWEPLRADLLRRDRFEDLRTLSAWQQGVGFETWVEDVSSTETGLRVVVRVRLVQGDGTPVTFRRTPDGKRLWVPPFDLDVDPGLLDFTRDLGRATVDLVLFDPASGAPLPDAHDPLVVSGSVTRHEDGETAEISAQFDIDPGRIDPHGRLRRGRWHVWSRPSMPGLGGRSRLHLPGTPSRGEAVGPAFGNGKLLISPVASGAGNLVLAVSKDRGQLLDRASLGDARVEARKGGPTLVVELPGLRLRNEVRGSLVLDGDAAGATVPLRLRQPPGKGPRLVARFPRERLGQLRGRHRLSAVVGGRTTDLGLEVRVGRRRVRLT